VPGHFRIQRPPLVGGTGLLKLKTRNPLLLTLMHDAVKDFIDRHHKKLMRHVNRGSLTGVDNFMHIFLAIAEVIHNQVEEIIADLETKNNPMSIEEWYKVRQWLDDYYPRYKQILVCLCQEYIEYLFETYKSEKVIEQFLPHLELLNTYCEQMLYSRDRIESLRNSKLRVKTPNGDILVPPYNEFNIFYEQKWDYFKFDVEENFNRPEDQT
jgi:small nuclear ribonucleoprotein (snRNP)-like protein